MRLFKTCLGLMGFIGVIAISFYIISDIEKTPDLWNPAAATTMESEIAAGAEAESPMPPAPEPAVMPPPAPRPPIEAVFTVSTEMGEIAYMLFGQDSYNLPVWFGIGLEAYLLGGGIAPLSNEDLALLLGKAGPPFGDAWLVPSLRPRGVTPDCVQSAAYTIVRRWSLGESLQDFVTLAQEDAREFTGSFNAYIAELTGNAALPDVHFLARPGDFKVLTCQGIYVFVKDNYDWAWPRVLDFVLYMDAAILFVRDYFSIENTDCIRVTLYPFGVVNVPSAIAELAEAFGWDAPDINFVANDEIVLAGTARFGTWAISHEVAHILLFREFPDYRPPTWLVEGMAVLGEMLFRYAFDGTVPYRFNVPRKSNINNLARRGDGHIIPLASYEATFGRSSWTYDDVGSFMLYLYNIFGIEALLTMYQTDNDGQFDTALEIFGKELEVLMESWRVSLWPGGEPEGWWCQ